MKFIGADDELDRDGIQKVRHSLRTNKMALMNLFKLNCLVQLDNV